MEHIRRRVKDLAFYILIGLTGWQCNRISDDAMDTAQESEGSPTPSTNYSSSTQAAAAKTPYIGGPPASSIVHMEYATHRSERSGDAQQPTNQVGQGRVFTATTHSSAPAALTSSNTAKPEPTLSHPGWIRICRMYPYPDNDDP